MGALFGKSKKPVSRVTSHDKVILQLKQQRDKLKQYQKRIEMSLGKDRLLAKKCLQSGRKERAKLLLRKKKYQEKLLENADAQLENLEKLASDIEFSQMEQEIFDKLKEGNAALKTIHDVFTIEDVEQILDETREGVEKQREIDDILSGALTEEDEDAVMMELDALVAEEESSKRLESEERREGVDDDNVGEKLPDVPTDELLPEASEEEKKEKVRREKEKPKKVLVEA